MLLQCIMKLNVAGRESRASGATDPSSLTRVAGPFEEVLEDGAGPAPSFFKARWPTGDAILEAEFKPHFFYSK